MLSESEFLYEAVICFFGDNADHARLARRTQQVALRPERGAANTDAVKAGGGGDGGDQKVIGQAGQASAKERPTQGQGPARRRVVSAALGFS